MEIMFLVNLVNKKSFMSREFVNGSNAVKESWVILGFDKVDCGVIKLLLKVTSLVGKKYVRLEPCCSYTCFTL